MGNSKLQLSVEGMSTCQFKKATRSFPLKWRMTTCKACATKHYSICRSVLCKVTTINHGLDRHAVRILSVESAGLDIAYIVIGRRIGT